MQKRGQFFLNIMFWNMLTSEKAKCSCQHSSMSYTTMDAANKFGPSPIIRSRKVEELRPPQLKMNMG